MSRKIFACFAILAALFSSHAQGDGLIYVATQDTDDLQELYSVNVSGSGGSITAATPVKISAPQPVGGGVVFGIPNFGNPDQVLYGANQDDPNKMDLYIVNLAAPGTSIKINADLTADQEIGDDIAASPDGTKVVYSLRTISTGTVDLYIVTISNPGVATKLNPDLVAGRKVEGLVFTPDSTRVIYGAQINSDAQELFVTELSNPGVATKADGPPAGADHVIQRLSVSRDGAKAFWVGGRSMIGQNKNLLSVSLNDLGNEVQVNEAFSPNGEVTDYDVSPDGNTVVYRGKTSFTDASNVYVVDLSAGAAAVVLMAALPPGTADQVNPDWASGGIFAFSGLAVSLLDDGTVAMYNGPLDDADVVELYETPLNALQTSTKLNDALPLSGAVSFFRQSRDDTLVMYSDGPQGFGGINVVDRSSPGSAVQPFVPAQNQALLGSGTMFNTSGDLIASTIANLDGQGMLVNVEFHVADPTMDGTNIRANTDLAAGLGVLFHFWLPTEAVDTDGDGVPDDEDAFPNDPNESVDTDSDGIGNNADTDDDNDAVPDGEDAFPLDATESADTDSDGIGNNADTDDDGDTMPDDFETSNGLDPLDAADAAGDADGDGFTNLEEFEAGTDPQNVADFPGARKVPVAIFIILGEEEN